MGEISVDVTGVILAGGESSRMGRNKAFLEVGGERLVDRAVSLLEGLFEELILIANDLSAYAYLGLRTLPDRFPGKKSLGGIHTALLHMKTPYCFVAACDMPFLKEGLVRYLLSLREGYEVVVPRLDWGLEPLCAVYSQACLKPIERLLNRGDLKIINFFPEVRVCEVARDDLMRFDPELDSFFNINTPEDLARANRLLSEKKVT
ncbi:MAG: molybdenum cofactor guanylyltransferase [Nitrospinota bacterium]